MPQPGYSLELTGPSLQFRLDCAEQTLLAAGYTRCDNGNWKPPIGPSASPLLDQLDAERQLTANLASQILELAGAALPHRADETLRKATIAAVDAALVVLEDRKL